MTLTQMRWTWFFSLKKMLLKQEDRDDRKKIMFKETSEFHLILANIYYKQQLKRKTKVVFSEDVSMGNDDI